MASVILNILKFLAIGIAAASGIVGTITDSKDKTTGRPTVWGKRIVALIVISSVVGAGIQAVESYLKSRSDADERSQRDKTALTLKGLVESAQQSSSRIAEMQSQSAESLENIKSIETSSENTRNNLSEQEKAIAKTATLMKQTEARLTSLTMDQQEFAYSVSHPLGDLQVDVSFSYPATAALDGWLRRVITVPSTPGAWFITEKNRLPNETGEISSWRDVNPNAFLMLKLGHGEEKLFYAMKSKSPAKKLTIEVPGKYVNVKIHDTPEVAVKPRRLNWGDLYGAKLFMGFFEYRFKRHVSYVAIRFGESRVLTLARENLSQCPEDFKEILSELTDCSLWSIPEDQLGPRPSFARGK